MRGLSAVSRPPFLHAVVTAALDIQRVELRIAHRQVQRRTIRDLVQVVVQRMHFGLQKSPWFAQATSIRCRAVSFRTKDRTGLFPGTVLYSPANRQDSSRILGFGKLLLLPRKALKILSLSLKFDTRTCLKSSSALYPGYACWIPRLREWRPRWVPRMFLSAHRANEKA